MQLQIPFIRLPLVFDAERLQQEVLALPEALWRPHPQGHRGNSAVPLVAAYGDVHNELTRGPMRPTPQLADLPYVRQVMAALECSIGRSRLMRIDGNGEASMHVDTNYYWATHARVHVPVLTHAEVHFVCGEARVHMAAGECWIFDTWSRHNVLNPHPTRRIHLVCDVVGSPAFWQRVAKGRSPESTSPTSALPVRMVRFDPAAAIEPVFERCNQPVVMSPFEVRHWRRFILTELRRSSRAEAAAVQTLGALLEHFEWAWTDAWAQHGTQLAGHAHFRVLLDHLEAALAAIPAAVCAPNGTPATEMVRQFVVRTALNPDLAETSTAARACQPGGSLPPPAAPSRGPVPVQRQAVAPAPAAAPAPVLHTAVVPVAQRFDRPIFIVSPPRSGSSLLFEALAQAPGVWTIGGESHLVMESIPALHPAANAFASNAVDAAAATATTVAELAHGFFSALRDRDGQRHAGALAPLRFLEKTPKNALRIPFLAQAFPDALFVYLHRDPRDTISSMLDAWRSQRFITYPQLPGWRGAPWSFLLPPGWREWQDKPLHEVVARQWGATVRQLIEDLGALDPLRVRVIGYADLLQAPQACLAALCDTLDLGWDRALEALPWSRHTLTPPAPDKWRRNAAELEEVLPIVQPAIDLARVFFETRLSVALPAPTANVAPSSPPADGLDVIDGPPLVAPRYAPSTVVSPPPAAAPPPAAGTFNSVYTASMARLLAASGSTLILSTYQSGRTILLRADGGAINTHFKAFPSPMGIACRDGQLALATARQVWEYQDQKGLAQSLEPAGRHDACFVPRKAHLTGDIRVHEIAYAQSELWIVNTRFSCLCTLDGAHSFVPRWKPDFISRIESGDRCHLNGMCIVDGQLRFVTALGRSDAPGGWRAHKAAGGLLIDVASHAIVAHGLSMPHSPRWYDGRLWVLESGKGSLSTIDPATGASTEVVTLPGFTRGLAFHGEVAFIGLSQVRESVFGGLPLTERPGPRACGIWAVHIRTGQVLGFLRFEGAVQELFDVQLLPGLVWPELLEPEDERLANLFIVPESPQA